MPTEYKLDYRKEARISLAKIYGLHKRLVGPKSARKITDSIKGSLENLRTNPHMGMPCRIGRLATLGYRFLVCGKYLAFYRVIDKIIYVYHILDGRTDYEKKLASLPSLP